ncbi:hypothetical protein CFT9_09482 [Pseudomonas sp. CFT9]|nr:hypothetical protein CFT9_09482 [Pseudomonas sp. CFT9]
MNPLCKRIFAGTRFSQQQDVNVKRGSVVKCGFNFLTIDE